MIKHAQFKRLVNERKLKPTLGSFQSLSSLTLGILKRACHYAQEDKSTTLKPEHIERVLGK